MSDNTKLADTAAALLQVCVDGLTTAGLTVPERQYVSSGSVAYDCEQLVVTLERLYPAVPFQDDPGAPVLRMTLLRAATLGVHLVRCIPTLSDGPRGDVFPTPADLDASGMALLTDALVLPKVITTAWRADTFLGTCDQMGIREVLPAEPDGGFGGTICRVDVQL